MQHVHGSQNDVFPIVLNQINAEYNYRECMLALQCPLVAYTVCCPKYIVSSHTVVMNVCICFILKCEVTHWQVYSVFVANCTQDAFLKRLHLACLRLYIHGVCAP